MIKQFFNCILLLSFTMFLTQCNQQKGNENNTAIDPNNPLLQKWTGPYNGVPPFDKIKTADFRSALEAGMTANREEIDRIAGNQDAPTFKNTIEELEKTGFTQKSHFCLWHLEEQPWLAGDGFYPGGNGTSAHGIQ
jgi:peptidyl-dipeptidase Dcp